MGIIKTNKLNTIPNAYEVNLLDFTNCVLVVCPKCAQKAVILKQKEVLSDLARFTCKSCGKNEQKTDTSMQIAKNATDPFFGYSLWLQKPLTDGIFWTYNEEHLAVLAQHIAATLRSRDSTKMRNSSLGSRLPKWMTAKKNRATILKTIELLKKL